MKKLICCCYSLFMFATAWSQLPTGPDGKTLYQKGECKVLIPNVSYKCTFCEDKDLKVNCKSYDCSLTACKESKSIKGSGANTSPQVNIEGKQVKFEGKPSTTGNQPETNMVNLDAAIEKNKKANGTSLLLSEERKYKLYATFKNNKVESYYLVDNGGNRIEPEFKNANLKCEFCFLMNSQRVCYEVSCDNLPPPKPPTKQN